MAQCMRHAPLYLFTPSCLDMHGEYILTGDIIKSSTSLTNFYFLLHLKTPFNINLILY
jgi:hypothetical protein